MGLFRHLLLAFFCCTIIFTADSIDPLGSFCDSDKNAANSPTPETIGKLIANVVQAASRAGGFATASYGVPGNQAYGLAQCRGDVSTEDCKSCLQVAAKEIRNRCTADGSEVRIWYDFCFLKYKIFDFFGIVETDYAVLVANTRRASHPHAFTRKVLKLMGEISKQAILPANKGLGKGKVKISAYETLYALVQCTRDLAPVDCAQCIAIAVGENFGSYCKYSKGCRAIYSSCYVRYELYPFYFPIDSPVNSTAVSAASDARNYRSTVVIKP